LHRIDSLARSDNNQYQVVNYNLFTPGKPLPDNLLWICEQVR